MKKFIALCMALTLFSALTLSVFADNKGEIKAETNYNLKLESFDVSCDSAILMEAETGTVLYAKSETEPRIPASVTKVMTLLLVMEAIESGIIKLTDSVRISAEAASMGGSQVFLEEGEHMTVEELLKCTVIASANDAAYALAEQVAGSEKVFVDRMNAKAIEMNLPGTHFENVTGLDDETQNHVMSAEAIAKISAELLKYPKITEFSTRWQDSIRDGEFTLTNTNRLVRFYDGCTGLKTGSTSRAGYCVSATATRDGMSLIAVVLGCPTKEDRTRDSQALLDYGFSNFAVYRDAASDVAFLSVFHGESDEVIATSSGFSAVVRREDLKNVVRDAELPASLSAPVLSSQPVGILRYSVGGNEIGRSEVYPKHSVGRLTFGELYLVILEKFFAA